MSRCAVTVMCCALIGLGSQIVSAQSSQPDRPVVLGSGPVAASQPGEEQDGEGEQIKAKIIEIKGSVVYRSATKGGQFQVAAVGILLPADTLISVGPKGHAVISFGENAVVVVEQFSIVTINELYRKNVGDKPTVVTRLKVVNGSVRAGVERGRTQSDMKIATPVATLTVAGTWPIRMFYDSGTGMLTFNLGAQGWIRAQLAGGGRTLNLGPGESSNQNLASSVLMAQLDQSIRLGDPWGGTWQEHVVQVTTSNNLAPLGGGTPQEFFQNLRNIVNSGGSIPPANPPGDSTGGNGGDCQAGDDDSFYGDDDSFYGR